MIGKEILDHLQKMFLKYVEPNYVHLVKDGIWLSEDLSSSSIRLLEVDITDDFTRRVDEDIIIYKDHKIIHLGYFSDPNLLELIESKLKSIVNERRWI